MLELYSRSLMRIAFLQNAYGIKTTTKHNGISNLEFKIPSDDAKLPFIEQMTFVRYVDDVGNKSDFYRVVEEPQRFAESDEDDVSFYCEHGLITLIDKVMFGTYTVGGVDYITRQVLEWVLSKQTTVYWQLGICDFSRQFEYSWSQENLLSALFSVPNAFDQPYRFTFNMNTTPWTLNLELFDELANPKYYVTKKMNQLKVMTSKDSKQLATKVYPLGFGEGVNQLTIKEVNSGVPYLIAPPEVIAVYGEIEKVIIDRRFQNAQNLKDYAQTLLNQYMNPYKEYEIKAVDLFKTGGIVDKLPTTGDIIYVPDGELRLYATEIVSFPDNEGETVIKVANKSRDVSSTMATLSERQRIEQVYAQGATNIFSYSFRDNADPDHGLIESFYIPREALIINSVQFKYELRRFRSYEKATKAGGAILRTTGAGGGDVRTSGSNASVEVSTMNGGGGVVSSRDGGGASSTTNQNVGNTGEMTAPTNTRGSSVGNTGDMTAITNTNAASVGNTGDMTAATNTHGSSAGNTGDMTAITNTHGPSNDATGSSSAANTGLGGSHAHSVGAISENAPTSTAGNHAHTGPSHTHTGPSHTHSGPEHVHTGNSHSHAWSDTSGGPSTNSTSSDGSHSHTITNHRHAYTMGATYTGYEQPGSVAAGSHTHTLYSHTHDVGGTTEAAGTGNTGAAGTGSTGESGTGYVSYAGTGNTSSTGDHNHTFTVRSHDTGAAADHNHAMGHTHSPGIHTHQMGAHWHNMSHTHQMGAHWHDMAHTHQMGTHWHNMDHVHEMGAHWHNMEHTHTFSIGGHVHEVELDQHSHAVNVPSHTHSVTLTDHTHEIEVPDHTHDLEHGIYEAGIGTSVIVKVDGVVIPVTAVNGELDISIYLSVDEGGKIRRGTYHDVEIIPNALSGIVGSITAQLFIQSTGGGDF